MYYGRCVRNRTSHNRVTMSPLFGFGWTQITVILNKQVKFSCTLCGVSFPTQCPSCPSVSVQCQGDGCLLADKLNLIDWQHGLQSWKTSWWPEQAAFSLTGFICHRRQAVLGPVLRVTVEVSRIHKPSDGHEMLGLSNRTETFVVVVFLLW